MDWVAIKLEYVAKALNVIGAEASKTDVYRIEPEVLNQMLSDLYSAVLELKKEVRGE